MPRNAATNRFRSRDFLASLNFSASTDKVNLGTDFVGTGDVTVFFWINPRTMGGSAAGRVLDNGRFIIDTRDTNRIGVRSEAVTQVTSAVNSIVRDRWSFVTVLRTSAGVTNIKINNVQSSGVDQSSGTPVAATTNICIGNQAADSRQIDGKISNVLVFNRILNTSEQSEIYFNGSMPSDYATSCIYDGRLNEGAGTSTTDYSGNGHTGTITGATYSADVPMKARKLINANMVKNGDFEYAPPFTAAQTSQSAWIIGTAAGSPAGASENPLFGWGMSTITGSGSGQFDSSIVDTGSYSLKVSTLAVASVAEASNFGTNLPAQVLQYGIRCTPNTAYILTFRMRTNYVSGDSNDGAYGVLTERNAAGGTVSSNFSTKVKTTTGFTTYTVSIVTGSTTVYLTMRFGITGNTGTGTLIMDAWYDNVTLLPVYPEGRVPANGNLVKNFDFEVIPTFVAPTTTVARWIDGSAAGSTTNATYKWGTNSANSSGAIAAQFDSSTSNSGSGSMKVSTTATASTAVVSNALTNTLAAVSAFSYRVNPGISYTYSVWMKTNYVSGDSDDGAYVQFTERNAAAGYITSTTTTKVKTTTGWTNYTGTITTNAATVYLDILFFVRGTTGAGTLIMDAWFDDIYLAPTTNPGRIAIT